MSLSSSAVASLQAWECLDSRGRPTVACRVTLASGASARALAPSGASVGAWEASRLVDGEGRFGGKGMTKAASLIETRLIDQLKGVEAREVDNVLSGPANVTLAVSVAAAKAGAADARQELWQYLSYGPDPILPCPMINIFSGGRHAHGSGPIQDYLVIPMKVENFREAVSNAWDVRLAASQLVASRYGNLAASLVADEGGLALPTDDPRVPLDILSEAISSTGHPMAIGLDVAANEVAMSPDRLLHVVESLVDDYDIVSIEDPVGDDNWELWTTARTRLRVRQLVADDLTATDAARIERVAALGAANGALVKPDQIGTLSAARTALIAMRGAAIRPIISARSGDTEDDWLADVAVGWGVEQIKIGSLARSERNAKYNRLLEVAARHDFRSCSFETIQ